MGIQNENPESESESESESRIRIQNHENGRARIVNLPPGSGDASACLKLTLPGDPARPHAN